MKQPLSGGRRQRRLADLHRAVSGAIQSLHQHQMVLVTALRGDDAAFQQTVLEEHGMRVAAAMQAVATLATFVDRWRLATPSESEAADGDGSSAIMRAS